MPVIILVRPFLDANVGSVSRAMLNFGFHDLRIVNPTCDHLSETARTLAVGSIALLENAKVYNSLESCIADLNVVVATSARIRHHAQRPMTAAQCASMLMPLVKTQQQHRHQQKVGIMFGSETNGLSAAEMAVSHFRVGVPTFEHYGVLNLAQAVSILTYECWAYLFRREEAEEGHGLPEQQEHGDSQSATLDTHCNSSNRTRTTTTKSTSADITTGVSEPGATRYRQRHQEMLAALSDEELPAQRGSVVSFLKRLENLLNSPNNGNTDDTNSSKSVSTSISATGGRTDDDMILLVAGLSKESSKEESVETNNADSTAINTVRSINSAVDDDAASRGFYTERNMRDIKAIFQRVSYLNVTISFTHTPHYCTDYC